MARGPKFKVNQREIDQHVKKIADGYKKASRRHGPTIPIQAEAEEPPWPTFTTGAPHSMTNGPNPLSRRARVRRAFLRWFAAQPSDHPGWKPFLEEGHAVDAEPVGEAEVVEAVQRLLDDGLLGGPGGDEQSWPALLELTAIGRRCLQDHEGDTVAWAARHHRGGSIYNDYRDQRDQRVYAEGAGQVAAHSSGTHQEQHGVDQVDIRGLRSAARYLLANLDDLADEGFDTDAVEDLEAEATLLATEASQEVPDSGRLHLLAESINTRILGNPTVAGLASGGTSGTVSALLTSALSPGT